MTRTKIKHPVKNQSWLKYEKSETPASGQESKLVGKSALTFGWDTMLECNTWTKNKLPGSLPVGEKHLVRKQEQHTTVLDGGCVVSNKANKSIKKEKHN
eukprot:15366167-Ditylum_brightwellii.AAC.3